jgi:hypothetical protein
VGIYIYRNYALAELRDSDLTLTSHAKGRNLIVLGNDFSKQAGSQ